MQSEPSKQKRASSPFMCLFTRKPSPKCMCLPECCQPLLGNTTCKRKPLMYMRVIVRILLTKLCAARKHLQAKIWLLENGRKISEHNMRECCFFAAGEVSLGSSSNRLKVDYWCTTEITTWRMSFREMVNGPSFILSLRSATPEKRKRQIRFLQKICWKRSSRTCQRPKSCWPAKS